MWLLLLLLSGAEIFVIAENSDDEIKDDELSRKILGQSVVTSVSVVMDIGNGTKTIFTDPLGKPMEKPLNPTDLASPINLLNPDRYEFYTFDDNGNLVRRLMSLEEIKGIIATGDSDGLEYDSVLSESYIPEKRVNDVLSNVQNVLKEEMEIHSTKLEGFPVLDTPDVSESWNMILPAVFGNSGADITPDKPPLHVTPDTIMIEPTEKSSTPIFSTPILSTSTSKAHLPTSEQVTTPNPTTIFEKISSSTLNQQNTESKDDGITLSQTTKEYIPLITVTSQSATVKATTYTEIDSTDPPVKTEYVKIDQIVSSTESNIIEKVTDMLTTTKETSYTTVTIPTLRINSTSEITTVTEASTTNVPELTIQSVQSSINCTSAKNETDEATTVYDSIDKIAAPEILNQLLSTPLVGDLNADISNTMTQLLYEVNNRTVELNTQINNLTDRFETTPYVMETITLRNDQNNISTFIANSTEEYATTETYSPEISTKNISFTDTNETEGTTIIPTTISIVDNTIVTLSTDTEKNTTFPISENQTEPLSIEIPVKSTKIEDTKEIIKDDEQTIKTTQNQDKINTTTISIPLTFIDSSTITTDFNETTIRVPLIDPSNTIKPYVGIIINENASEIKSASNESQNNINSTFASIIKETVNMTESLISLITEQQITTTILPEETESFKKEPNWTLVPTIAPHSAETVAVPPLTSESYPDMFEPPEPIILKAEPLSGFGLEESTSSLDKEMYQFAQLYNELAFEFWKATTSSLSHARSLVLSPFGTISLLAMIFLGARGSTSAEMNEILKLDDMITFNPHLVLKNVGESISFEDKDSGIITSAFIKELFMCRMKGKMLPFYKERVKAFYDGYAEEVNFAEIGDIIRRRTNLQVKKHSEGRIPEFLSDISVTGRPPLVGLGVNLFQTGCSGTFSEGRDGEMHFAVLPTIRQRRLVPIPAVLYKSGFLAGYEPSLDATAVSLGGKNQTISTIFVMSGQQGTPAPGDGLARLEKSLVESSFKKGAWARLLRSLIPRSGLEVQIPRLIHRSVINATESLKKMGFIELFKKGQADLVGMNGISNDLYLSDVIQINQFTTCGEKRTEHHSEIYPNSIGRSQRNLEEDFTFDSFEDSLHERRYLTLPLPLRPRQARKPDTPRLKFDRPFLYFVRHNPTGLILHIGRFNPRLLP